MLIMFDVLINQRKAIQAPLNYVSHEKIIPFHYGDDKLSKILLSVLSYLGSKAERNLKEANKRSTNNTYHVQHFSNSQYRFMTN